jgi:hypothetical protein
MQKYAYTLVAFVLAYLTLSVFADDLPFMGAGTGPGATGGC